MRKLYLFLLVFGSIACTVSEPAVTTEIFARSTPEAEGISSQAIIDFIDAAEREQPDALHSIMIVRNRKIVAEGWWDPYNADSPHELYSLSKSFTSTAVGLAIGEGLLTIDDQVISFFPDQVPENPGNNLQSMRIRDLITMNTGHEADTWGRILNKEEGSVAAFLSLDVERKPGTIFVYNTGATYMLAAIVQKVSGQSLIEYLKPRLFVPLAIEDPFWITDSDGINVGGWGLSVKTLDIAKLGQLYLQKGNWNGQQILAEEWVNTATSLQTSNGSNPESDWDQGYGYQFWRCRHNNYRGDGAFGQYCIVMPDKNAVIAITSGSGDMQGILDLVWDYLLPAMQGNKLPADDMSLSFLTERLENLALLPVKGEESSPLAGEISGEKFIMESNELGVEAISFSLNENERYLSIWNGVGEQYIPVGFNAMLRGKMSFPDQADWATASSGAWISDDNYQVKIYNYESPHAMTFDFTFAENSLTWDSEYNVAFGPSKLPKMTGNK